MGYDLRLHVGELLPMHTEIGSEDSPMWMKELARIELGNPSDVVIKKLTSLMKKCPYCFFYADDGDTQVIEDKYSDRMKAIPANKVLEILKKNNPDNYHRYNMAIAFLEETMRGVFTNLVVVCYGH